jgi:Xaa-Pro aminopeptidase
LSPGSRVGVDAKLFTVAAANLLQDALSKSNISLVSITENLVDLVWGKGRPATPSKPVFALSEKYTGKSTKLKIDDVKAAIEKKGGVWGFVITTLDEIACKQFPPDFNFWLCIA